MFLFFPSVWANISSSLEPSSSSEIKDFSPAQFQQAFRVKLVIDIGECSDMCALSNCSTKSSEPVSAINRKVAQAVLFRTKNGLGRVRIEPTSRFNDKTDSIPPCYILRWMGKFSPLSYCILAVGRLSAVLMEPPPPTFVTFFFLVGAGTWF